jgi:ATP-dependent Clp protease ATP-binding subunit ClpA
MSIWEELIERTQQEAAETGSPVVEVEHLLLAVLRTPSERLREVLEHLGWTPEALAADVRRQMAEPRPARRRFPPVWERLKVLFRKPEKRSLTETPARRPVSEGFIQTLDSALREAVVMEVSTVWLEHLFVGILGLRRSWVSRYLRERGVTLDRVRPLLRESRAAPVELPFHVSPDVGRWELCISLHIPRIRRRKSPRPWSDRP